MNTVNTKTLPAPPNLIHSLLAGFDSITNHLVLILFPICLDLLLWIGPRLRLNKLVDSILFAMENLPGSNTPEIMELLEINRQMWSTSGINFNLLSLLRTYPVGIPSLMVSIQPASNPFIFSNSIEIISVRGLFGIWLLFSILGLAIGAFYFWTVSQAALSGKINWLKTIYHWPWISVQVWLLAILWITILAALSVPGSCIITVLMAGGASIGRIGILIFMGMILWLLFPLVFSSHGIFVNQKTMWASVKDGVRMTRYTFPATALFVFMILVLSEGLDMLWRIPGEKSWLTMIGLVGHGFIASGILASTFIYYRDATSWVEQVLQRMRLSSAV